MSVAWLVIAAFFIIALVYSSVGFGGGSSYLAVLALPVVGLAFPVIRSTALFCNLIVVTGGLIVFYREGKLSLRDAWPYLLGSVPMAYIGGKWPIQEQTFFILLGFTLVVVPFLLWFQPEVNQADSGRQASPVVKGLIGGAVGLLSGLVGIGGGIFLSPILHFLRWSEARRISALASLFIFVNSIGGLAGQFRRGIPDFDPGFLVPLLLAVFLGGQIGSRLGVKTFNPIYIKRITAVLILIAGLNILKDHL
ncbi:MAG TPA: sulfite exporter TauE/SafE family protein [Cyclobacteriaceae bacterium]|nr:sulfite exporter TauE/SafE family protein [Cyclobacteriaceae bacterium]HQQ98805.1 sulfite exporter TauE/SafE family protein [Cyclobacteriaceae bacterium]